MNYEGTKLAVVDLGTNTFNLLIVLVDENGQWRELFRNSIPVMLAKGGIGNHTIARERVYRGLDAMMAHKAAIQNFQCKDVLAYATSAVREAGNGVEFVDLIRQETGISVTIIDGNIEAELIHLGVNESLPLIEGPVLMMDIGGGSTEFIISENGNLIWKASFPLGVSRIAELVDLPDPLLKQGVLDLEDILESALEPLAEALKGHNPEVLVGASGSFNTFMVMLYHRSGLISVDSPGATEFEMVKFRALCNDLIQSDFLKRLQMPGMHPTRADTLQLSSALVQYVLKRFKINRVMRSKFALREGAVVRALKN